MPIKFLLLRGGRGFFWKGGGASANSIFMGAGIFLTVSGTDLGHDVGGCKTYGGRKTYQRTPEKFWTPPKELLVCSAVNFCTGKTEQRHSRGVENVPVRGGSKTPFWEGCHS